MGRVLVILVLVGLLVLALSVPALAGASNPPNAWGQEHRYLNWDLELDGDGNPVLDADGNRIKLPPPDGAPGHRDTGIYFANPGQFIVQMVIQPTKGTGLHWSDFVAMSKDALSIP